MTIHSFSVTITAKDKKMTVSHVLARKYRPQTFADLIGQEALVQTITNAIDHGRLAHAYMLTGIRGIGKTTSARIIAKGLNCIGVDGNGSMTPNPCGQCKHCREIAADAHIDVIEIDAASNTGVDNVREIIEGAKYNPVSARYKIYIIDEVHMLSKAAFNALLKTLEEPPERIKFIFATTEIRKVPVTILSRCQRFDLKRLDEETLTNHLMNIIQKENATAEKEALQLIARAGDGSVRDSLSLLDQAITQFDLNIKTNDIRQMLGLSDRTALFDLYDDLMHGKIQNALDKLDMQYKNGSDSLALAQDMLSLTHWLTRVKITPELVNDITIPEAERIRGKEMAQSLSMGALTSAWQLLLKGLDEVKRADNPLIALEMVLIRLAYLSELPSPAQLIEDIKKNGLIQPIVNQASIIPAPVPATSTAARENTPISLHPQIEATTHINTKISRFKSITDMAAFARTAGDRLLAYNIENYIRPVSLDNFVLTCDFTPETPERFSADLINFLRTKAGESWKIDHKSGGMATIKEKKEEKQNLLIQELAQTSIVAQTLKTFPQAKISKVKQITETDSDEDTSAEEE